MKKIINYRTPLITVVLYCISLSIVNAQCAMCRAVLQNGDKQEVAEGINNGILYLMIIPYVLIAIVGYAIYKSYKKKRNK